MAAWRISYGSWIIAGALAMGGLADAAGQFVAPREGPVAFRRDRLPIHVDLMTQLSAGLVVLAKEQRRDHAADRRTTAQMLALALALNPASSAARAEIVAASNGKAGNGSTRRDLDRIRAEIWGVLKWLNSPEAGPDGQALGACLGDVISNGDPTHLDATALLEKGERGAWAGWIAPKSDFEKSQIPDNEDVKGNMGSAGETAAEELPEGKITLEAAAISTPLMTIDPVSNIGSIRPLEVAMTAVAHAPDAAGAPVAKPMAFSIDLTPENSRVVRMNRNLQAVLATQYRSLPMDSQLVLKLGEGNSYLPARDGEALSGAAAVLAGAALSGNAPTGTVIGKLERDGSFRTLPDFWDRLRALSDGPGGRLVIPAEAADLLPWLLTLEETEFFLKYDVLIAANYAELVERSAAEAAAPLADVLGRFEEIRTKGETIPIGRYVANRFVRQRLTELSNEASYFLSPQMLALQGAGERPARIPDKVLAHELRRVVQPLAWVRGKNPRNMDLAQFEESYQLARAQVDKLERYAENRELLGKVRDMTNTMRTFARAAARNGSTRERDAEALAEAFAGMMTSITDTQAVLDSVIGGQEEPDEDEGQ